MNTVRHSPDLRIEQHATVWRATTPSGEEVALHPRDPDVLRTLVTRFVVDIEPRRPQELAVPAELARDFLTLSTRRALELVGESVSDSYRHVETFRQLLFGAVAARETHGTSASVEIVNYTDQSLPWELMGPRDSVEDVEQAAFAQLGFACRVWRQSAAAAHPEPGAYPYLQASPRLRIKYFRNAALGGTITELKFFCSSISTALNLIGPLPDVATLGALELAEHLVNPSLGVAGSEDPDQIVHISCHHGPIISRLAWARAADLALAETALEFGDTDDMRVTVPELSREMDTCSATVTAPPTKPLVFLNVCNGDFYPWIIESIAQVLIRNENPALISTAMAVPDVVAAEMTRLFYSKIFDQAGAAEALMLARQDLLFRRGSPLGTLYSFYGDPDLRVVRATNPSTGVANSVRNDRGSAEVGLHGSTPTTSTGGEG